MQTIYHLLITLIVNFKIWSYRLGQIFILGEGNDGWDVPGVWHAFYINDKGRSAIKTIDLERNGKFGYKKILRCLWYAFIILLKDVVLCLGLGILLSYFCVI